MVIFWKCTTRIFNSLSRRSILLEAGLWIAQPASPSLVHLLDPLCSSNFSVQTPDVLAFFLRQLLFNQVPSHLAPRNACFLVTVTAGYGGRNGKVSGAGTVRPVRAPCQIVSPSCPRLKVTVKACKYCSCYTWRAGSAFEVAGCGRLSWLSRSANGPCACLALWRSFWWCLPEGAESPSKESLCMDGKTQFLACADFCFLGAVPAGTPDACSSVCVHWTRIALIISDSDRQSLLQSITNLTVQLQHWHLGLSHVVHWNHWITYHAEVRSAQLLKWCEDTRPFHPPSTPLKFHI